MAVRNSISSGHYILSTIHADKAASIPNRMYSLLETNQDIDQFLKSIYRYVQIGVYIRGYQSKETKNFVREIAEVTEFYVTENNEAKYNTLYKKTPDGNIYRKNPSKYLIEYLEAQGTVLPQGFVRDDFEDASDSSESNGTQNNIDIFGVQTPVTENSVVGSVTSVETAVQQPVVEKQSVVSQQVVVDQPYVVTPVTPTETSEILFE